MSWIVLILVSIFTALVNFVFLSSGTETSQKPMIIFNCAMLIGYVLMYMFYGSKRQSTLKTWLPIKSKIKAVLLRGSSSQRVDFRPSLMNTISTLR
jgi:uncharacterized integral membrane protein